MMRARVQQQQQKGNSHLMSANLVPYTKGRVTQGVSFSTNEQREESLTECYSVPMIKGKSHS